MQTPKATLLAHRIHHFTPWATWRHPRDHFVPLFSLALVVLAGLIVYLLKLEAMYREDARSTSTPPLRVEAPVARFSPEPGAVVVGQRNGQPRLNW